ncbi:GapS4b family protein [Erwinia rhapontici]|uniref:GapS4b family protein n=1 Tax=Erwinia rhapontici TaxID=55212 RepID=UPI003B9F4C3B
MEKIILPSGDNLKTILSQTKISKSDVKSLLRQRGVFFSNDEKNNTVPVLMKTLISPSEFNSLIDKLKTKEQSSKISMRTLDWNSDESLIDAIGDGFDLSELIEDPFTNYEISYLSDFYVQDGLVALDFQVKRTDLMSGWNETEQIFSGRIELEKKDDHTGKVEVNISINHTSNETKVIADKILKKLNVHLKEKGHIRHDTEILKIQFNHFSNENRIAFLNDLSKSHIQNEFYFKKIIDVDFHPDEDASFPPEMKWLEKNIEELKLKGTLGDSVFFKNKNLHPNLKITKLVANYTMQDIDYDAECKISYEFPEYANKKNESAELVIDFKSFNGKGASNTKINSIKSATMKTLESRKITAYEHHRIQPK